MARTVSRLLLTAVALLHLGLVEFFPGGRNSLFNVEAPAELAYPTLIPVRDALGFYGVDGDRFLMYRVYSEDGAIYQGTFPAWDISPHLRRHRWVMAGRVASRADPRLHAALVGYVVARLPAPPLRLELFAAHKVWPPGNGAATAPPPEGGAPVALTPLGYYDGVQRKWISAPGEKNR